MKVFVAVLTALVVLPLGAALGYVAHQDPAPPAFGSYLAEQVAVKHIPGQDTDNWLAQAVTGPNKGGAMDVTMALAIYATHDQLEQSAQGKVVYVERKCSVYSTSGKKDVQPSDTTFVQRCDQERKTRKQAESYMRDLMTPEPKS